MHDPNAKIIKLQRTYQQSITKVKSISRKAIASQERCLVLQNSKHGGIYSDTSEEVSMIKKHEKIYYIHICYMKYVFYAIDKTIAHSNDLLICFCLTLLKKCLKCIRIIHPHMLTMEKSVSQTIGYVRNVKKQDCSQLIFYQE